MRVPKIEIELADARHSLRYDFRALQALEEKFGVPFTEISDKIRAGFKLSDVKTMLWAGLLHETPDLGLDAVDKMIEGESPMYVVSKITEAMTAATVRTDGERKNP
jgi:hypothetical protein